MSDHGSLNDLAEHLRTVNLTLTVISTGLLLAAVFGRTYEIDRARDDVREIIEAVQTWDDTWFADYVREQVSDDESIGQSDKLLPERIDIGDFRGLLVDTCARDWALPKPEPPLDPRPFASVGGASILPPPEAPLDALKIRRKTMTLSSFRDYWNALYRTVAAWIPESLDSKALVEPIGSTEWQVLDWVNVSKNGKFGGLFKIEELVCGSTSETKVLQDSFGAKDARHNLQCVYKGKLSEVTERSLPSMRRPCRKIQLPASVEDTSDVMLLVTQIRKLPIRPQQGLRDHLRSKDLPVDWRFGSFEYSFPELNRLTADFQDLPLERIETILRAQKLNSTESIEVVGIKLAPESIRSGGALLILGVQVYFLLHLRELGRKISSESAVLEIAWIGLYPGMVALAVFAFSAFVLPSLAVLVLCSPSIRSSAARWPTIVSLALVLSSLFVSGLGFSIAYRLRKTRIGAAQQGPSTYLAE